MWNDILNIAITNGIFAALFVALLIYELKDSRARENKYQQTIQNLNDDLKVVNNIKENVTEIKQEVTEIEDSVGEIKSNITTLKKDVVDIKSDVSELKLNVEVVKQTAKKRTKKESLKNEK